MDYKDPSVRRDPDSIEADISSIHRSLQMIKMMIDHIEQNLEEINKKK